MRWTPKIRTRFVCAPVGTPRATSVNLRFHGDSKFLSNFSKKVSVTPVRLFLNHLLSIVVVVRKYDETKKVILLLVKIFILYINF